MRTRMTPRSGSGLTQERARWLESADAMSITRKTHGLFDYLFAILVAASPWIFGFAQQRMAPQLAFGFGAVIAFYSFITNYELGVVGLIPFAGHRLFDFIMALAIGGALWHFDMKGRAGVVFAVLGVLLALVAAFTRRPQEAGTMAR